MGDREPGGRSLRARHRHHRGGARAGLANGQHGGEFHLTFAEGSALPVALGGAASRPENRSALPSVSASSKGSTFLTRIRRRYLPLAFTEQGVAMLSSVLRSPRAVQVNVEIMRAFVRLRAMLGENVDLARKLARR